QLEEILNTVDRLQQSRLDDQRTTLPINNRNDHDIENKHGQTIMNMTSNSYKHEQENGPDDQFFDILIKCQDSRFDDQRATLPGDQNRRFSTRPLSSTTVTTTKKTLSSTTLPDDEFFSLLDRVQSRRLNEQRSDLPLVTISTKRSTVKQ
ncbi:unnamed protein product, partial [Didymodactylos carnosus]